MTINGLTAKWAKISFTHPTSKQLMQGYVWAGFIAEDFMKSKTNPTLGFLYGVSQIKDNHDVYLEIRVISNQKEVHKTTFKEAIFGIDVNHDLSCLENCGVPKIHNILQFDVEFLEPVCAIESSTIVFFWDGEKLYQVKKLQYYGREPFSITEEFIYPIDEKGKFGKIIFQKEDIGEDDNGKEYHKKTKEEYYWTGTELKK